MTTVPRSFRFGLTIAAALAALCACGRARPEPAPSGTAGVPLPPAAVERRGGDPVVKLIQMLSGRYDGATPGNQLRLNLESVAFRSLVHPYDMFLEVSGQFDGTNVHQQGFLDLESQGRGVSVRYLPLFDPTAGPLSRDATRFGASEANAACSLSMQPRGDGFVGETQGPTCALAIRGAVGPWSLQVEPGTLVVRSESSGETLRFRRVSGY